MYNYSLFLSYIATGMQTASACTTGIRMSLLVQENLHQEKQRLEELSAENQNKHMEIS